MSKSPPETKIGRLYLLSLQLNVLVALYAFTITPPAIISQQTSTESDHSAAFWQGYLVFNAVLSHTTSAWKEKHVRSHGQLKTRKLHPRHPWQAGRHRTRIARSTEGRVECY